jgi:hypothetical protein
VTARVSPAATNDGASDPLITTEYILPRTTDHEVEQSGVVWTLSPAARRWLTEWADALMTGSVSLAQLPPEVVTIYLVGHLHAEIQGAQHSTLHDRIARLEWECGYWRFIATNRKMTGADYYRHVEAQLWAEGSDEVAA